MNIAMWAIVPCKRLDIAKRRLARVLSPAQRRDLVIAMLGDVLDAVGRTQGIAGTVVVSSDPGVADIASAYGARCIGRQSDDDLSAALTGASDVLHGEGVGGIVAVSGDLPLITPIHLSDLLAALPEEPAVAVVPATRDRGTNVLAMRPTGAITFLYGPNSAARHVDAARRQAVKAITVEVPELGLDIDEPADLYAFLARPSDTETYRYLTSSGVGGGRIALEAGR